ncbi:protein of unknown function [Methylocella tundrae]|uniref:Aminotransferase n=1 Tax=Methylocella tundrae TaxID=227605 RepID=A0A4V6IMM1_METTU|nr:protein of unknown function [Methylocella tundrae]
MTLIADLSTPELAALRSSVQAQYDAFRGQGLKLDMTRGKPAPDQLDLANAMLALPGNGDYFSAAGEDGRNYGNLQGLAETRALFSPILGAPVDGVVVGDNSSLALMHDCIVYALLKGVPGSARPWSKEGSPAFICPAPGYDRHFAILEEFGIRMLPVAMTGHGPDMDAVEKLAADPSVKGMWCVPKYSNPTGEIYSDETIARLAAMRAAAPDFRLFWDNAYCVHHLTERRNEIPNILEECERAGHPDRAFIFASTSKVTLAGAGVAFFRLLRRQCALVSFQRVEALDRPGQAEPAAPRPLSARRRRHRAPHGRPSRSDRAEIRRRRRGAGASSRGDRRRTLDRAGGRLFHQRRSHRRNGAARRGAGQGRRRRAHPRRRHLAVWQRPA